VTITPDRHTAGRISPASRRWRARIAGAAIAGSFAAACHASGGLSPLVDRLDVVPGRPALAPVAAPDGVAASEEAGPKVVLEDGRRVAATLYRFEATLHAESPQDRIVRSWLGPTTQWHVRTAAEAAPDGAGAWALLIDIPPDASGREISIGSSRITVNWLEDAERLPLPQLPPLQHRPDAIAPWIEALEADPQERWRAALLRARLPEGPDDNAGQGQVKSSTDRHPALKTLARQSEDRWRAALRRLAAADEELTGELLSALTDVIDFGSGRIAPAWAISGPGLVRLRDDLLDPRQDDEWLINMTRQWLRERPGLTTWVIDDAGATDAMGVPIVTIGVAERRGRVEMAGMRLPGLGLPEGWRRTPLRPLGRIVMVRSIDAGTDPVEVEITAGDQRSRELVLCNPVEITPPGLVIGPFLHDLRMVDWDAGAAQPAVGDAASAALLQRGERRGSWELYIECRTPERAEDAPADPADFVRIWLGSTLGPAAALRVEATGAMRNELKRDGEITELSVQRSADRWSVVVPIPAEAIEADGTLRLALERHSGRGERSTWPRALLPWSETPGRLAIDLSTWKEIGE